MWRGRFDFIWFSVQRTTSSNDLSHFHSMVCRTFLSFLLFFLFLSFLSFLSFSLYFFFDIHSLNFFSQLQKRLPSKRTLSSMKSFVKRLTMSPRDRGALTP